MTDFKFCEHGVLLECVCHDCSKEEGRREGLEEAAEIAESFGEDYADGKSYRRAWGESIAKAIRKRSEGGGDGS